jgi:hypothetical protein
MDRYDKGTFKIEYSSQYAPFRQHAVTIFKQTRGKWRLLIPDMCPSILRRCKFPSALVRASERVVIDREVRVVVYDKPDQSGSVKVVPRKPKLFVPPPKPKLFIPK